MCLQEEVMNQLDAKNSDDVLKQFSFQDLKDLSIKDRLVVDFSLLSQKLFENKFPQHTRVPTLHMQKLFSW